MKKIVCLFVLLMCAGVMQAQWSVSPELGITAVNRNETGNERWNAGWKLGVAVEYQFTPLFSLKSGIHYTQRKSELLPYMWYDEEGDLFMSTGNNKRHFLQLPVMAQLGWNLGNNTRLNIAAGPYVGYCIHHPYGYGIYNYSSISDGEYSYGYGTGGLYGGNYNPYKDMPSFDWGASFAVGLEVKDLYFNVGYDMSLAKEYKKHNDTSIKYHTLSLTVGYKFRIGK